MVQDYRIIVPSHLDAERPWQTLKDALIGLCGKYTETQNLEAWQPDPPSNCRRYVVPVRNHQMPILFALIWLVRERFTPHGIYVASEGQEWLVDSTTLKPANEYLEWAQSLLEPKQK